MALGVLLITMLNIFSAKIKGEVPRFFGYSVMHVVSESMEDTIPKDTYILVKRVSPEVIEKGDIICFYSDDFTIQGYPNTHRVAEDPIVNESGIEFVTRGDANYVNDNVTAKGDKLIGRYVKNLTGLTKLTDALEGKAIFFILGSILLASMAMISYTAMIESKNHSKENQK